MTTALPSTRLATLPRRAAVAILAVLIVAMVACIAAALLPISPIREATAGAGDLAVYGRIVERLQAGETYYPAAHVELVAGGYGVQSVFNWRTPFFPTLLAAMPTIVWGQGVLMVLAIVAGAMAVTAVRRDGNRAMAGAAVVLMILGLSSTLAVPTVLFSELTAGILIFLSALAYGLRWRWLGLVAAVLGLVVRELAAPYVLVCIWFAWRERRWPELLAWLLALAAYAAFFGWHYAMVQVTVLPTDPGYSDGWLALGGLQFILRASAFNGAFALLPLWVSALILPLGVIGLFAWPGAIGRMLAITVVAYLGLFLFVGRPANAYWGALFTPLLTLGLVWVPAALRDLVRLPR